MSTQALFREYFQRSCNKCLTSLDIVKETKKIGVDKGLRSRYNVKNI